MMEATLIKCGRLYDGIRADFQTNREILVVGGRIAQVGKSVSLPGSYRLIDLSDATVTPGMIDAHTHLSFFEWRERKHEAVFSSPVCKAMAVLYNAERALRRGFTTLRHMGSNSDDGYGALDAKRVIAQGRFPGSRLVILPYAQCTPGSHGDSSQMARTNPELARNLCADYPCMGSGVDFFRDSVRKQIKYGADLVKLILGGGFSTPDDSPDDEQMTEAEMQAVIETAHSLGKRATAHVYAPPGIVKLARLGIDELQHCAMIDEEAAALLEQKGIPVVTTFAPYEQVVHPDPEHLARMDACFREKLLTYAPRLKAGREILLASGITLGFGSDLVSLHRSYEGAFEYQAWMRSGADPFRILRAATAVNARLLELDSDIGTLEPGKVADIAAWRRDLLTDPDALMDCAFVMKAGEIYETEAVGG